MKDTIITELIKIKVWETTTEEQLISKADSLNDFQKMQDGFIDAELIKEVNENSWSFIYHYESFEKLKAIGEKLRSSKAFEEFNSLIIPGTFSMTFFQHFKKW